MSSTTNVIFNLSFTMHYFDLKFVRTNFSGVIHGKMVPTGLCAIKIEIMDAICRVNYALKISQFPQKISLTV